MTSLPSIVEIVVAVAAAFLFGGIAQRLGQPPVLGYILAGVAVGPYGTGLIKDPFHIALLAQLGVAFLMFQAGSELSLSHLRRMSHFALLGPLLQLALTVPLIVVAGLMGMPWAQAVYLGLILSLSSTTMVIKLLSQRGEMDTLHGRLALPFSIVQDLPIPLALVVVSAVGAGQGGGGLPVVLAMGKAVAFVLVVYGLGAQVVPALFRRVARWGRELLLLAAVALALGMAYVTNMLGVSMALGAFVAGLLLSETEVSRRVLKEVSPVSDIFVTFFFLSVGMLLDIPFVRSHLGGVGLVVGLVVVVKTLIILAVGVVFGFRGRTVVLMALLLAQIGEEAFLLAQTGLAVGFLTSDVYSLVLAGAVLSIMVNPALVWAGDGLTRSLRRLPWVGGIFREPRRALGQTNAFAKGLVGHTIICGYGQVGEETAQALERRGFPYVVIDLDRERLRPLQKQGVPCIVGDAADPAVLEQAGLAHAAAVAITFPEPRSVERVVRAVRGMRQGVEIIARASGTAEEVVETLREAGASEVIHPSFEASLGFVRSVLRAVGVPPREVERFVLVRRVHFYG
ncbi:MAG: cation:proton antiporter [Dehalococcoidia bacterium]|nr:cation:proton antiporter [Dehalococcoidia bacterium]MDW8120162.1 cation:proton antiporter [Chloroflexota bacterium]